MTEPTQPPYSSPAPAGKKRKRMSFAWRFALVFVVATIILAIATWWLWQRQSQQGQQIAQMQTRLDNAEQEAARDASTIRAVNQVVGAPDTIHVTLTQQPGGAPGQGQILYNARLGLLIYSGQIASAPEGKEYELWVVPATGAPVSAGVIAANQQNAAVVAHVAQGTNAKTFAVTLEPKGGSPGPSGARVLLGPASPAGPAAQTMAAQ